MTPPFIAPAPGSHADPNRHECDLPRKWRETRKLPQGTRFQCPGCGEVYVWTTTYASMDSGPVWDREHPAPTPEKADVSSDRTRPADVSIFSPKSNMNEEAEHG